MNFPFRSTHRILLCIFLIYLFAFLKINAGTVDSLKSALRKSNPNSERTEILNLLSFHYLSLNTDSALSYANEAIQSAKKLGEDSVILKSYILKEYALENQGELEEALLVSDTSLLWAEKVKKPRAVFAVYASRATLFRRKANYDDALTFYLKCVDLAENNDLKDLQAKAYGNLGIYHMTRRQLKESEEWHLKALALREKLGATNELCNTYENLGIVNREKKDYHKALEYYFKALEIVKKNGDSSSVAFSYNDIGAAYSFLGETAKASYYLSESIRMRLAQHEMDEIAYTYNYMGENEERMGNLTEASRWIHKALSTAIEIGNNKQHYEALESLSDFYARNKMADSAYHYLKLHKFLKDSLREKDNEEVIARLKTKYETSQKEKVISAQLYELSKKNWYVGILICILSLGAIVGWLIFRNRQHRAKKKLQEVMIEQQDLATKAVIQAEENERQRIAADLHDGIGQMLTAVRLNLEGLHDRVNLQQHEDQMVYQKVLHLVEESAKEVRTVSHSIMPNALIKSGLGHAIKDFVEKINTTEIIIHLHTQGLQEKLDTNIEIVVYRIIQECVNNVIKHSKANKLDISILKDDEGLRVTIEDNGIGFNKANLENPSGIGMRNIQARVDYLKGNLDIDTQPGKGTLIAFFIPTD